MTHADYHPSSQGPGSSLSRPQPSEQPGRGAHFAGLREFMGGPDHIPGRVQRVHVISSHAFGEIRSYVLDEARCLRLRPRP